MKHVTKGGCNIFSCDYYKHPEEKGKKWRGVGDVRKIELMEGGIKKEGRREKESEGR